MLGSNQEFRCPVAGLKTSGSDLDLRSVESGIGGSVGSGSRVKGAGLGAWFGAGVAVAILHGIHRAQRLEG